MIQLQNNDTDKQTNQRIQISRLGRELRDSKERVKSLELQVDILRKKLNEVQENRLNPALPASHTPLTMAASEKERRKLAKQLDQYKVENDQLREELVILKAQLLDSNQTQVCTTFSYPIK